jgi:UDP-3-O-[3-hydroxymyristoyl] glucosamine N-acyltransferase
VDIRLADIATRIGAELEGDASILIRAVAGVRDALPGEISFVSLPKYAAEAASTKASALIVRKDWKPTSSVPLLRVGDPEASFYKVALLFAPPPVAPPRGIHPAAVVDAGAKIGRDALRRLLYRPRGADWRRLQDLPECLHP